MLVRNGLRDVGRGFRPLGADPARVVEDNYVADAVRRLVREEGDEAHGHLARELPAAAKAGLVPHGDTVLQGSQVAEALGVEAESVLVLEREADVAVRMQQRCQRAEVVAGAVVADTRVSKAKGRLFDHLLFHNLVCFTDLDNPTQTIT